MKALTLHPYYAGLIFSGKKTVELRTWRTDYRGDILITSSAKKYSGTIPGHALCIAELYDICEMSKDLCQDAGVDWSEIKPAFDLYAWKLRNIRIIEPIPVKGKLSLWNYDGTPPKIIGTLEELLKLPDDQDHEMFVKYWKNLFV